MGDFNAKHPTCKGKATKTNDKMVGEVMMQAKLKPVPTKQAPPGKFE